MINRYQKYLFEVLGPWPWGHKWTKMITQLEIYSRMMRKALYQRGGTVCCDNSLK